jgi:hypothetical protein
MGAGVVVVVVVVVVVAGFRLTAVSTERLINISVYIPSIFSVKVSLN